MDWVVVVTFGQLQQHAGSPELASFLLLAICFFLFLCFLLRVVCVCLAPEGF